LDEDEECRMHLCCACPMQILNLYPNIVFQEKLESTPLAVLSPSHHQRLIQFGQDGIQIIPEQLVDFEPPTFLIEGNIIKV